MSPLIPYKTKILDLEIGQKNFKLEVLDDLDHTIDEICSRFSQTNLEGRILEDLCPYFGVLWPSGRALADFLSTRPDLLTGKKVLEVGCGLALPSLVAGHFKAQVLASDFHPDVPYFLKRNCEWNQIPVPYLAIDWKKLPKLGPFDLVIGSDILYEGRHPQEVAQVLSHFISPQGTIIVSDPGRTYLQDFADLMEQSGYESTLYPMRADDTEIFLFVFRPKT